jgi:hypothetical protein
MNRYTHCRIALLGLASFAGEDDQAGLVCLQPLHVDLLALLAQIPPPVINHNSNTSGLLPSNTSLLELRKSKSTAFTNFAVVADGLSTDGGAEEVERADAKGSSLGLAGCPSAELAAGLVEPGAHTALPVLPEMVGGEDCVDDTRGSELRSRAKNAGQLTVVVGETHVLV